MNKNYVIQCRPFFNLFYIYIFSHITQEMVKPWQKWVKSQFWSVFHFIPRTPSRTLPSPPFSLKNNVIHGHYPVTSLTINETLKRLTPRNQWFWCCQHNVRYSLPLAPRPGTAVPATTSSGALNKFNFIKPITPSAAILAITATGTLHLLHRPRHCTQLTFRLETPIH